MSAGNNYTGDDMKKRISTLEKTIYGGDKPQDSLVSMFHNTNKLIQEFIEDNKRSKRQIVMFFVASIGSSIACIFTIGYKTAEFDMMQKSISTIQKEIVIMKDKLK